MPEDFYDREFPRLRTCGWEQTSDPDNYNCIALAVGDHSRYWWPNEFFPEPSDDYWPDGVPNEETIEAFTAAFATRGFTICKDGSPELGYDKTALYAKDGIPKHAARLQQNGKWQSKLGPHEDIETTLEGLAGPYYGQVVLFFKRVSDEQTASPVQAGFFARLTSFARWLIAFRS